MQPAPVWQLKPLPLDLQYTWRISRNASTTKNNLLVQVQTGGHVGIGEAAPNVRYNESAEAFTNIFDSLLPAISNPNLNTHLLIKLMQEHEVPNALSFAITSAFTHAQASAQNISVSEFLKVPAKEQIATSFSIPIMEPGELENFIKAHQLARFTFIKVKVEQNNATETLQRVHALLPQPLFIDGNEAWTEPDEVLAFIKTIHHLPILFLEQPMPAALTSAYQYLKKHSTVKLMADESITNHADFNLLSQQFDAVNVKLMKAGSYEKAIQLLSQARKYGLQTMLGCMIESGLGIWSAMQIAGLADYHDLDGCLFLKNDPMPMVKEKNGLLYQTKMATV